MNSWAAIGCLASASSHDRVGAADAALLGDVVADGRALGLDLVHVRAPGVGDPRVARWTATPMSSVV